MTETNRNQFGAFGGVFTPCILTILGVILFMRANFVIGEAGIFHTILILLLAKSITLLTTLSTSAISTNLQVRGGGAYYLISRVLGPEYGGAIGVMLFFAQAISVPFYVLGFTEALTLTFPGLEAHATQVALATAAILFIITYIGAGWAIRVQYLIMAILAASILIFLGGAVLRFSPDTFAANLRPAYTLIDLQQPQQGSFRFWQIFAIYFPAVTGIMAGINMSGDLKNPAKAIPRGTLAAIGVGFLIYLIQIFICGGAFSRLELTERPYLSLKENALFHLSPLVTAGMFAATLSSALGSFMGAPRVLQAVARDNILPGIKPFGKGSSGGDEPRRALLVAAVITLLILLWAGHAAKGQALNQVAEVITEFFLCTYGMLNVAAFIEGLSNNPSFRPRFRYFHWTTALAGAAGCIAVAFIINPVAALIASAFLAVLVRSIKHRELQATFGDARRGYLYRNIRNNLIRLSETPETPKNWRPTCLVFSGNPESREALVNYAVWFEAGRGLVFLVQILLGTLEEYGPRRAAAVSRLKEFCAKREIEAFPVVVVDPDLRQAMSTVMQSLCVGPIRPNLALFGWSFDPDREDVLPSLSRLAHSLGMAVCILRPAAIPLSPGPKRIDVWWRGMQNGGLMMLLAHLLRANWQWNRAKIRLLRLVPNEAGRPGTLADLEKLLNDARLNALPEVIVSKEPFSVVLNRESGDADVVFLGFEPPQEGEDRVWHTRCAAMLCDGPAVLFVSSGGGVDLLA